ncbi:MAG TPA: ABC transporter substrate-binding protein [Stellaceae bacterium]|nr:ABC transporter substrate-binding protein [Stellaceae bacterium]
MRTALFLAALLLATPAAAEDIKVGIVKTSSSGHVFVAVERGYFAAEGFDVELVPFEAAQPVAIAVVTGDIAFGVSALTAGFYSLAGQGALKLIAGQSRDLPTYQNICYLASNHAFEAGLTAPRLLAGHSMALTQIGAPGHYALGRLAEKYGFDIKGMRLVPLHSFPNIVTALAGNQVDAGMLAATPGMAAVERGAAHLIGWVGDETPWQIGGVFATAATAEDRIDFVERFLRAYRRGARDYFEAFSASDGTRRDGPTAPEILAIIAKYTGEPVAQIRRAIGYVDPEGRLDRADIRHQIAWYKSQNMLKDGIDGEIIIDPRYAQDLPAQPER